MNLLIVGGTGTLGRQIARHALDKGYQVRCLVRNLQKASFLKEWGVELVKGNLCDRSTLPAALEGIDIVIDASTARVTDSLGVKEVDWQGKVNLIQAAQESQIKRFIFFSILNCEQHREIPLMDVKYCIENFLKESGLNYTILRLGGFMQGLVGQYAVPILDNQVVWVTGESSPIAYMNTQDVAKFGIRALEVPATENNSFPILGTKTWGAYEIVDLCERLSGKKAKISRVPIGLLRALRRIIGFFQWGKNAADRLAFAEVLANGKPLEAPMEEVYQVFGLDVKETTTLEEYFQDYFSRILKKLKELGYDKKNNKKTPFKSKA
jgi:uncharacterized protein YbjT (DUF2867 family)